jgi:CheY-like chemotaxis protein
MPETAVAVVGRESEGRSCLIAQLEALSAVSIEIFDELSTEKRLQATDLSFVLDEPTADAADATDATDGQADKLRYLLALQSAGCETFRVGYRGADGHTDTDDGRFSGFVAKPATRMSVIRCLRPFDVLDTTPSESVLTMAALKSSLASGSPDLADEEASGRGLKILLAEDNIVNQRVLAAMLLRKGHSVEVVENGAQALAAVQADQFDVILMDINMPEMDGVTATRAIRSLGGETAAIPIIAVTANALRGDREKFIDAGMDDYVSKPVSPELLNAALDRHRLTDDPG